MPPPSPKENLPTKENIPPRPRVVGSPVASPSSEALRDGSNAASPPSRFEALGKGSNSTPQSRSVTLSPKKNVKSTMAPAHVDDKPIPRVVSKEETKEEPGAPKSPAVVQKKHEPPSFLRDLVLYAALGASLGAAFALAVPPLPPPPEAAPSRLLIKAPLAPPPRAAVNTQLLLAKDAEIERLRTEVKWALTDRGSDAAFKQELKAHEQRTQQMLKELLREKDALAARDTVIAELRAELRSAKLVAADAAVAPAPTRGAAPPAPGRRRRRLRRAAVAAAVVVVLPPTRRALFAFARALLGRPPPKVVLLPGARPPTLAELPPLSFPAVSHAPRPPAPPSLGNAFKEARLALGVWTSERLLRWRVRRAGRE
ncbi:unnamed protein product [Pelagomonas calceolata]|uniref:Uncharacterized protein n=1 Tax=Pelagomonas calceolata TaxID=35677 RepID=A0A7S4E7P2_9STRA|nr:unnamed protein product [Pelagomonas calceolata]